MKGIKKILIIGGAGFIGMNLSKKLVHLGYDVIIYDNFSTGKFSNIEEIKDGVKIIKGDILYFRRLSKCITKHSPEVIFHLAAIHYIPYCIENPLKTYKVNVNGTENILKAISSCKKKPYFFFISSAAVYKNSIKSLSENNPLRPIDIYGKTKLLGEKLVKRYCYKNNIQYNIVRLFNTYGPGDTIPHVIPRIIKQIKQGATINLGNLKPERDFIFIDDVIDALYLLLIKEKSGEIYNLGTGKKYSIDYVTKCLRNLLKATNKHKIKIKLDKNLFRKIDKPYLKADIRKISQSLHWKPQIDIKNGLKIILMKENLL